jgi:hypothetical protein
MGVTLAADAIVANMGVMIVAVDATAEDMGVIVAADATVASRRIRRRTCNTCDDRWMCDA